MPAITMGKGGNPDHDPLEEQTVKFERQNFDFVRKPKLEVERLDFLIGYPSPVRSHQNLRRERNVLAAMWVF
jgi:hypothetical protein